jgi:hypothetical protein
MTNAKQIADILAHDLGIDGGIRYAESIAANRGTMAYDYGMAASILHAHRLRRRAAELAGKEPGWTDGRFAP